MNDIDEKPGQEWNLEESLKADLADGWDPIRDPEVNKGRSRL